MLCLTKTTQVTSIVKMLHTLLWCRRMDARYDSGEETERHNTIMKTIPRGKDLRKKEQEDDSDIDGRTNIMRWTGFRLGGCTVKDKDRAGWGSIAANLPKGEGTTTLSISQKKKHIWS